MNNYESKITSKGIVAPLLNRNSCCLLLQAMEIILRQAKIKNKRESSRSRSVTFLNKWELKIKLLCIKGGMKTFSKSLSSITTLR
jgi:hypothetical protein